jgi:hypothetical protein
MASSAGIVSKGITAADIDSRWYCTKLTRIPDKTEKIFESYCGIPKEKIIPHIIEVVSDAAQLVIYIARRNWLMRELHAYSATKRGRYCPIFLLEVSVS